MPVSERGFVGVSTVADRHIRVRRSLSHAPWNWRQGLRLDAARASLEALAVACLRRSIRSLCDRELATVGRVQLLDQVGA